MIRLKRAYLPPDPADGFRVLVDRLWPRGLSKEAASIDLWLKEVAPSAALRKWFAHDPKKWTGFQQRYKNELKKSMRPLEELHDLYTRHKTITLVFAAKDEEHNQAAVLKEVLSGAG
jgi:uncharacterized protein YeaO (DUF488 family)